MWIHFLRAGCKIKGTQHVAKKVPYRNVVFKNHVVSVSVDKHGFILVVFCPGERTRTVVTENKLYDPEADNPATIGNFLCSTLWTIQHMLQLVITDCVRRCIPS